MGKAQRRYNNLCPCGSGKKLKDCCLYKEAKGKRSRLETEEDMRREVFERCGIDSCEVCGSPRIYLWIDTFNVKVNSVIRCGDCNSTPQIPSRDGYYKEPEEYKLPEERCRSCQYVATCKSDRKNIKDEIVRARA